AHHAGPAIEGVGTDRDGHARARDAVLRRGAVGGGDALDAAAEAQAADALAVGAAGAIEAVHAAGGSRGAAAPARARAAVSAAAARRGVLVARAAVAGGVRGPAPERGRRDDQPRETDARHEVSRRPRHRTPTVKSHAS